MRSGWLLALASFSILAGCSPQQGPAGSGGKELLKNGSVAVPDDTGTAPRSWVPQQAGAPAWDRSPGHPFLTFTADPQKTFTIRQEADLPVPVPTATRVEAQVRLDSLQRGEKSWYSGRILLTYLDSAGNVLGETYTLDRLEGSSDWKTVRRQFPVPPDAAKARIELQLLNARSGSFSIRNISLLALDSQEAQAWRKEATARILKYRTAPLRIRVEDDSGNPLPGAEVSVFMRRHAYPFGTAVKANLLTAPPGDPQGDAYRAVVENFFNYATLENELKAPYVERKGLSEALGALAWLQQHGLARRGHVLTWPSFEMSSKEAVAAKDDPEKLRTVMKNHFHSLLTATAPFAITDWDVLNEPAVHTDLIRILGERQVPEWFRWAREDAPAARLFLNENNVEFQGGNRDNLEKWIRLLQQENAPIGGLGWQGHMWHKTLPSGQNILDDLDHFAPYALPIQITEYDTHERFSDGDNARFMDEFLTAWFSHPLTAGFIMWGFQDAYMWNGNGPLFRKDWSLKPSGKAWMELVYGQWWTEASGPTDSRAVFEIRGYLGDYDIEVRHGGKKEIRHIWLAQPETELSIRLGEKSPADLPAERLVSSNPYRTGKLPTILAPASTFPGNLTTRQISLFEGKGAAALVPYTPEKMTASWMLGGSDGPGPAHTNRDLFLRFDPGFPTPENIRTATLKMHLEEAPTSPVRISIYALSPRFVPQGREVGLDWKAEDLVPGRIPGRSQDSGSYRLGDASVLLLGEIPLDPRQKKSSLEFSSGELTRAVQKAGKTGVTLIVSSESGKLKISGSSSRTGNAPTLELQMEKP